MCSLIQDQGQFWSHQNKKISKLFLILKLMKNLIKKRYKNILLVHNFLSLPNLELYVVEGVIF